MPRCTTGQLHRPPHAHAAWQGDFLELVATLREEFDKRWEGYLAYKKNQKGRSDLPGYSDDGTGALEFDIRLSAAERRLQWTPQTRGHSNSGFIHDSFKNGLYDSSPNAALAPPGGQPRVSGAGMQLQAVFGGSRQGSLARRPGSVQRGSSNSSLSVPLTSADKHQASGEGAAAGGPPGPRSDQDTSAATSLPHTPGDGEGGGDKPRLPRPSIDSVNFGSQLSLTRNDYPLAGSSISQLSDISAAKKRVAIDENSNATQELPARPPPLQSCPSRRLGDLSGSKSPGSGAPSPMPAHSTHTVNVAGARVSALYKAGMTIKAEGGRRVLRQSKSLYQRASATVSNLSALLEPEAEDEGECEDEECEEEMQAALQGQARGSGRHSAVTEVVQEAIEKMRQRAAERAAREAAFKERAAAVHKERSRMLGYYVWIDVCALAQVCGGVRGRGGEEGGGPSSGEGMREGEDWV